MRRDAVNRRAATLMLAPCLVLAATWDAGCADAGDAADAAPHCAGPAPACTRSNANVYSICGSVLDLTSGEPVIGESQRGLRVEIHETAGFPDSLDAEPEVVAELDACGRYRAIDFPLSSSRFTVVARGAPASSVWVPMVRETGIRDAPRDGFDLFALTAFVDREWSNEVFGEGEPGFADRGTTLFLMHHQGVPAPGVRVTTPSITYPEVSYLTGDVPQYRWLPVAEPPTRDNGSIFVSGDANRVDFDGGEPPGCSWFSLGGFAPGPGYVQTIRLGASCP